MTQNFESNSIDYISLLKEKHFSWGELRWAAFGVSFLETELQFQRMHKPLLTESYSAFPLLQKYVF